MNIEFITPAELQAFKNELLADMRILLREEQRPQKTDWIRMRELRQLLGGISTNSVAKLRQHGRLKEQRRIGSIVYYSRQEVEKLLQEGNQ
jgi:phage pi2 protein 07